MNTRSIHAGDLNIAYRCYGETNGTPVVLLHGFPYDVHCYEQVGPLLASAGCHVFVPFLRGFGGTRFLQESTLRSGQQAALASDLLAFLDALEIDHCVAAGFDWGGRAACIASALWPGRISGLVSAGGYNIQNIACANEPIDPERERQHWYQYYFHSERGHAGLTRNRQSLCRLLWELWSPAWPVTDSLFAQSAVALNNPDFVEVVVHSYRHRFGLVTGDPNYDQIEQQLVAQPSIGVPTIVIDGLDNGVSPLQSDDYLRAKFDNLIRHTKIAGVGHNVPQEAPAVFSAAVIDLLPPNRG